MFSKTNAGWLCFLFCLAHGGAWAADFNPAVLWPGRGELERNPYFLQVYKGVTLFETFQNAPVQKYRGPGKQKSADAILQQAAERDHNPIVTFGLGFSEALQQVAPQYPKLQFVGIDAGVYNENIPNLSVVEFANEEGAFLMGVLAAYRSSSNQLGFIGGMDVAAIREYACGYVQGAMSVKPDVQVAIAMISDTASGFDDIPKAEQIAKAQYQSGIDVIFPAAGASGAGVFNAAEQMQQFAIGVDANQNGIKPGTIVSSLLKRIDVVTYQLLKQILEGKLVDANFAAGIKEGAFDWVIDEHNLDLISLSVKEAMDRAKADIATGKQRVEKAGESLRCRTLFKEQL